MLTESLSVDERLELADLENKMVAGYLQTAQCLRLIKDKKLYREYGTWDEYLHQRWQTNAGLSGMTRQHAHNLIGMSAIADILTTANAPAIPANVGQARPLMKLLKQPEQLKAAVEDAVELAVAEGKAQPDSNHYRAAAKRVTSKPAPIEPGQVAIVQDIEDELFGQSVTIESNDRDIIQVTTTTGNIAVYLPGQIQVLTWEQRFDQAIALLREVLESGAALSDGLIARIRAIV